MSTRRPMYGFDTEDRKAYAVWLRRTLIAYGAIALFAIALVTVQAMTHTANVAEFAATTVTMTAP